jgi:hypothetical protein
MDPRALAAARNNACWCDAVCRSHGLPTALSEQLWVAPRGSPRLYPDAITLAPGVPAQAVLSDIETSAGCSVKDSFADVDLGDQGFGELFEATWLARPPAPNHARPRLDWQLVTTGQELSRWAASADLEGLFGVDLMRDPTVRFLVARDENGSSGGAIANRTGPMVGVSNVFTAGIRRDTLWADLPAAVGDLFERLLLVGYERGEGLAHALAAGFEETAHLRVWLKQPSVPGG